MLMKAQKILIHIIACLAGAVLGASAQDLSPAVVSPATVSSVRSIRGLPDALLRTRPAVSVCGWITFRDPASGLTYIEDDQAGIELRGMKEMDGLVPGRRVGITGYVDDSRPIPSVVVNKEAVRLLDQLPLPVGISLGPDQLRTGEFDGRRVILEAAVFRIELTSERGNPPWLRLDVTTPSGHLTWLLPWAEDKPLPLEMLHAKVRASGVCEAIFNNLGQRVGVLLLVGSVEDLKVIRPPLADPFAKPVRGLSELLRPGLDDPYDRVRIEGVVLCEQKTAVNLIHLRTAQGAIQVETIEGGFDVGDRVAVVGYPVLANKHVVIWEGVARKLGHEEPPKPLDLAVGALMETGSDSDLVRIRGVVLRNGLEAAQGSLFVESSERVVEVVLSRMFDRVDRLEMANDLAAGTLLELVGVVDLQGRMLATGTVNLTDMKLTLRTSSDVTILRAPPWWTTRRLLGLAGGLAAVLAMSGAWVFLLRRRVAAQTSIIGEKVGRETRWVERSRIARDIHDDVGSALTQITLLGDLGRRVGGDAKQAEEQFDRISSQARDAVSALDAIVWTVNPKNDSLSVAVSYLSQTVQNLARDAAIRCRLQIPEEIPGVVLGAKVRHNLLLAAKEAVHNVIKHSGAGVLKLQLDCGLESIRLEVIDDGCGFDPLTATSARTGLDSMCQRMTDIGGTLELHSEPGRGTTVAFLLPCSALK